MLKLKKITSIQVSWWIIIISSIAYNAINVLIIIWCY